MKKLNKKAQEVESESFIFYIVDSIVLSLLMIFFMLIIYNDLENTGSIPYGIEEFSAIERFQSEDCFVLDKISMPKAIDWNKFTKENLNRCYNVGKESKKIAFTLKLEITGKVNEIKTNNWNEELGPKIVKSPINVNIYYGDKLINGKLIISEQNV